MAGSLHWYCTYRMRLTGLQNKSNKRCNNVTTERELYQNTSWRGIPKRFLNSSTHWSVTSQSLDSATDKLQLQQSQNTKQLNLTKKQTNLVQWRWNCFADCMTMDTSSNSSTDTRLIRDIYCGPEVLFDLVLPWNSWWWWWWWHSMRKQSESNPTRNYSSQTSNAANKN